MTVDHETVDEIVRAEWEMFQAVQSIDGPAACQQSPGAFEIMRSSQLKSWSAAAAASYLDDLERARASGRNLMTEKYARMMEYTAPCEYRRIAPNLPPLEADAEAAVERLVPRLVAWMEEVAAKYPSVAGRGRPIRSSEDNRYLTSFETYTRGELSTYGVKTLRLLEEHYDALAAQGTNPAEVVLQRTVERYGYYNSFHNEATAT